MADSADELLKSILSGKWLGVFFACCAINGVFMAAGEHRFVAGFAEAAVATGLYLIGAFLPIFIGVYSGIKIKEKSSSKALGWLSGVVISLAVLFALQTTFKAIPGVGWRLEKMVDSYE